ncbi:MAG: DUF1572 family protein [Acidobacteriota bacterium]|nr:DUF1572 family protein [Acidobacteriota bacterium]
MAEGTIAAVYLRDIVRTYHNYKALGEKAIAQVQCDEDLHLQLDTDSYSIAVIVKHLTGNLRSRLRDFLTADGEKPDRRRDAEFEMPERVTRAELLRWWDEAWAITLSTLDSLKPEDLDRTVRIRGEEFLAIEALNRNATHTAYHVGQIVYLARHFASPNWKSLSIPKGKSAEYAKGDFKTKGIARTNP